MFFRFEGKFGVLLDSWSFRQFLVWWWHLFFSGQGSGGMDEADQARPTRDQLSCTSAPTFFPKKEPQNSKLFGEQPPSSSSSSSFKTKRDSKQPPSLLPSASSARFATVGWMSLCTERWRLSGSKALQKTSQQKSERKRHPWLLVLGDQLQCWPLFLPTLPTCWGASWWPQNRLRWSRGAPRIQQQVQGALPASMFRKETPKAGRNGKAKSLLVGFSKCF